MVKMRATGLVATIKDELKITPLEEEGKPGQLDVFVGDEQLSVPDGFFAKLLGKTKRAYISEIAKRVQAQPTA